MARLQQTQRKRVGSAPRLPDDVVAAIAAEQRVLMRTYDIFMVLFGKGEGHGLSSRVNWVDEAWLAFNFVDLGYWCIKRRERG
ncbi:hypothetical protein AgCh_025667 [Apium graveolens]